VHDTARLLWSILPEFLRDRFIQAFTSGLRDPGSRVMEPEWRNAMVHVRDSIMRCPNCRAENFSEYDQMDGRMCWHCANALPRPRTVTIGASRVVMSDDAGLFPHHLEPTRRLDFSAPLAVVSRHPQRPELIGLKNLDKRPWRALRPDGEEWAVDVGRSIALEPGTKILFGHVEGLVG
jgi:hypothetical protein